MADSDFTGTCPKPDHYPPSAHVSPDAQGDAVKAAANFTAMLADLRAFERENPGAMEKFCRRAR